MSIKQLEEALKDESGDTLSVYWFKTTTWKSIRSDILALIEKKQREMLDVKPGSIIPWPSDPHSKAIVIETNDKRDRLDRYMCAVLSTCVREGYSDSLLINRATEVMDLIDRHLLENK